jgi:hypothetical protein
MSAGGDLSARLRRMLRAPVGLAARYVIPHIAPRPKHELAVCAIFREEAPFLDEWLSFHTGVGITHFYLYNNFSTDNFRQVLAPWIERGAVTLTDWPIPVGQISAYKHCVARARGECQWLAFIDIDEFLFSPQSTDITHILKDYSDLPAVEVWQLFFGSGGHATRPALPVTEAYVMRAPDTRTTVKTIANPRLVYRPDVHQHKYWYGEALDTSRQRVAKDRRPVLDVLRINHYWSRSLDDLGTKVARGDASTAQARDHGWHFDFERTLNAERDEAILPVARAIQGEGRAS